MPGVGGLKTYPNPHPHPHPNPNPHPYPHLHAIPIPIPNPNPNANPHPNPNQVGGLKIDAVCGPKVGIKCGQTVIGGKMADEVVAKPMLAREARE